MWTTSRCPRARATWGAGGRGESLLSLVFTGKEDDLEVGLTYFGKRYLIPALGTWASPDPLAVHEPGSADLNLYAYVHARLLRAVDPTGLAGIDPGAIGDALGARAEAIASSPAAECSDCASKTPEDSMRGYQENRASEVAGHKRAASVVAGVVGASVTAGSKHPGAGAFAAAGTYAAFGVGKDGDLTEVGVMMLFSNLFSSGPKSVAVKAESPAAPSLATEASPAAASAETLVSQEETMTLYRGVNERHALYGQQSKGVVRPNNPEGLATPLEHNTAPGGTLDSPYTSWSTNREVAKNYALRPGNRGVLLKAEVPLSQTVASPNLKQVVLIQGGGLVSEEEVLVCGVVKAMVETVSR